jgi:hypothetical protein
MSVLPNRLVIILLIVQQAQPSAALGALIFSGEALVAKAPPFLRRMDASVGAEMTRIGVFVADFAQ